jgi:hypothetical protein
MQNCYPRSLGLMLLLPGNLIHPTGLELSSQPYLWIPRWEYPILNCSCSCLDQGDRRAEIFPNERGRQPQYDPVFGEDNIIGEPNITDLPEELQDAALRRAQALTVEPVCDILPSCGMRIMEQREDLDPLAAPPTSRGKDKSASGNFSNQQKRPIIPKSPPAFALSSSLYRRHDAHREPRPSHPIDTGVQSLKVPGQPPLIDNKAGGAGVCAIRDSS